MQYPIKVSVIIPVFNTKKYLRECLDSVVNQTLKDIEIILIDDGSTDGSAEICKSYLSDSRVSYYYKKNEGPAAARRYGVERANGEYIGFVDSDDRVELNMCEVMYASGVRENADVVMCNEFINDKKCSILMENCVLSKNDIERKILPDFFAKKTDDTYQMGVTVWWHVYTKIFRRQFIEKSGLCFDTQLYSGEDFLYSLKSLCLAEKLVCIFDAHCYHYMIRSSSITQNYRYGFIEKNFKIFSEINNCVTDNQNLFERINFYIIIAAADMINNEWLKSHLNKKEKIKRLDLIAKSPEIKAAVQNVSKDKLSFQYRGLL